MGKEGNNGLFISVVPKVYIIVLLFVGLTTLGTLNKFLLADSLSLVSAEERLLCTIIGDVHQFIVHYPF